MGDPSYLRLVPDSSANVPIDWSKVPEASKKFFTEGWCDNYPRKKPKKLPETIGEFAKMLDESKFHGYMDLGRCTLLLDISEFGLTKPRTTGNSGEGFPVGPHFYMKYLDEIWFVLLEPGERHGIMSCSPKIPYLDDKDEQFAEDKKVAEDYEPKLVKEYSQWKWLGAIARENVAGWKSWTLKSALQLAQIFELPDDHPAYMALADQALREIYHR